MYQQSESSRKIYDLLKLGEFEQVEDLIFQHMDGLEFSKEVEDVLQMAKFWQHRKALWESAPDLRNGEKLLSEWDAFIEFCLTEKLSSQKAFFALKTAVFRAMIRQLIELHQYAPTKEKNTLIVLGYAFHEVGMVQRAIETLEYALSLPSDARDNQVLPLLADLYSEKGDDRMAMALYNEVFYRDPYAIKLNEVEYLPIQRISEAIRAYGIPEDELPCWVPVYGYLYGGLSVHRKLSESDYERLLLRARESETALRADYRQAVKHLPALVNVYLWLFDYFVYQSKGLHAAGQIAHRVIELLERFSERSGYEGFVGTLAAYTRDMLTNILQQARALDLPAQAKDSKPFRF